ncbi:MAG: DUF4386 domain-containing protein [Pyrinomonadaceae bacterium]|nr:DUF4386 domain-containing protein [Pyrinomonadaceae bacterium]
MNTNNYAARVAGLMFLTLIAVRLISIGIFDFNVLPENLSDTLISIANNPTWIYISFFFLLIGHLGAIVLAVTLYLTLKSYDKNLALLAMSFRFAEAVISLAGDGKLLDLIDVSKAYAKAQPSDSAHFLNTAELLFISFVNAEIGGIGAITFAVGSFWFSYLFFRSRYVPIFISILGMIASLLVVIAIFVGITTVGFGNIIMLIWMILMVSELSYGFWLSVKGVQN